MKQTFKIVFYIFSSLCFGFVFTNANNFSVNFDVFVEDIVLVAKSNKKVSLIKFLTDFDKIKDNDCNISYSNSFVELSPVCFLDIYKNFNLDINESLSYLIE
jgi:hypothetical protein